MSNVIPMFREGPLTGLKEPNRKDTFEDVFIVVDENGQGLACCLTRNEAIVKLITDPKAVTYITM